MSSSIEKKDSYRFECMWDPKLKGKELEDVFDDLIFPTSLFVLHRKIEELYLHLPWPPKMKNITLLTEVSCGRGDVVAAAKTISLMQKMEPSLSFYWILTSLQLNPEKFLECSDPSKVHLSTFDSPKIPDEQGLFIVGPVRCTWENSYIKKMYGIDINGPRFAFLEAAKEPLDGNIKMHAACIRARNENANYRDLHAKLFPSSCKSADGLPMGLEEGTGMFIDFNRVKPSLSRGYCCPSYLLQLEDKSLQKDILDALPIFDKLPNYDPTFRTPPQGKTIRLDLFRWGIDVLF